LIDAEGFAGYGRWNRLLEIIAFKMDETNRCHVEYSVQKWCRLLGLKKKKLISFLELTEKQLKTKVVYSENKRDNYTKHLQVTDKPLVSIDIEVDKDKDKKKTFSSESQEIRLSELLLNEILLRNPDNKKPNIQSWAKHIDYMIRIDSRQPQDIGRIIKWCQKDSFWQNNVLCTEKLRAQYDKLYLKMNEKQSGGKQNGKFNGLSTKDYSEGIEGF
jgi:hypothetical protein